ncbi:MAG: hypothetical protein KDK23_02315 [Leptospiraceae bacterium]|nr:hypothetical protein [Leptospiraceae bacterium]
MIERMLDLSIIENQNRLDRSEVRLKELLKDQITALEMEAEVVLLNPTQIDSRNASGGPQPGPDLDKPRRSDPTETIPEHSAGSGSSGESFAVAGDPFLLGRAFSNVLRNALEFCGQGKIRCSFWMEGDKVFLEVFNPGKPVPDYALNRIFERFYSLPRPNTGKKSTGLGLPFVREVMELHGGSVELENAPDGSGVTVRLIFPRLLSQ